MYDEMLFSVTADKATPVERIDLFDVGLKERQHLQEWILANPDVLGPRTEIITSEYDRWQTADGDPVHDRLDILDRARLHVTVSGISEVMRPIQPIEIGRCGTLHASFSP